MAPLTKLCEDNLISILAHLAPPDLVSIKKTCKRLHEITNTRIVWTHACMRCISHGYPFPNNRPLESMSISELEISSHNSHRLGQKWLYTAPPELTWREFDISSSAIVDVRFVPGHGDKYILTVSRDIWSVLALWDVTSGLRSSDSTSILSPTKWSPKGGVFKSFCLNTDVSSVATLAIALLHDGTEMLYILSIVEIDGRVGFETLTSFPTGLSPVALDGDFIALNDQRSRVVIWNWRTNEYATLSIDQDGESDEWRKSDDKQVLFSRSSNTILVVRQQSIHLFPFPELRSIEREPLMYTEIAYHHFGLIASISVAITDPPRDSVGLQSFSIVLRRSDSNPWSFDAHSIEHYTLLPDPTYFMSLPEPPPESSYRSIPYIFPPVLQSKISDLRGSLSTIVRSSNMALGRNGTAVWINPRDRSVTGLLCSYSEHGVSFVSKASQHPDERLMAALFHGSLSPNMKFKGTMFWNENNNWTAMAYDEDRGRIVVGSSSGSLAIALL